MQKGFATNEETIIGLTHLNCKNRVLFIEDWHHIGLNSISMTFSWDGDLTVYKPTVFRNSIDNGQQAIR